METYFLRGLAWISLGIWLYLFGFRGMFWKLRERIPAAPSATAKETSIAVVIPARDEADVIGQTIASLRRQCGPFRLHITVADDESSDSTADVAAQAGTDAVVRVQPRPAGWKGKLWALHSGLEAIPAEAEYILFTDADIVYREQDLLARLLGVAQPGYDLVTVMAHLRCESMPERLLIPAFVYFFFKLYPPAWVERDAKVAAAAGGCMLIRRSVFETLGGVETYRDALIDDCALARQVKDTGGRIWLGMSDGAIYSTRGYDSFGVIREMIARSAFTQLRYSALLLLGTLAGMGIIYLAPVGLLLISDPLVRIPALAAWLLGAVMFLPSVRTFRAPAWTAIFLPAIAAFYVVATIESALNYWRGKGGLWKGRIQAD